MAIYLGVRWDLSCGDVWRNVEIFSPVLNLYFDLRRFQLSYMQRANIVRKTSFRLSGLLAHLKKTVFFSSNSDSHRKLSDFLKGAGKGQISPRRRRQEIWKLRAGNLQTS